jgi:hypothetical protein
MRYPLRRALWVTAAFLPASSGCSGILGFQDFTTTDGGESTVSSGGNGSASGDSSSGGLGGSDSGGGASSGGKSGSSGSTGVATQGPGNTDSSSSTTASTSQSTSSTAATSGPTPTCTYSSIPLPGGGTATGSNGGSATEYYFSQGTFMQDGVYKTACGYAGTEPTTSGFESVDTISTIAGTSPASDTYFAAIPGTASSSGASATDYSTFNTVGACGACVQLSANGKSIIATIVDECPISDNGPCAPAGHLDLSTSAFGALGYNQGGGGDPGGMSWQFVACPVTGGIQAMLNSAAQIYLQNTAFPITSVSVDGQNATLTVFGYWQLPTNAAGATVTLTDVEMDSVTVTIPGDVATFPMSTDLNAQFPMPTGCSN